MAEEMKNVSETETPTSVEVVEEKALATTKPAKVKKTGEKKNKKPSAIGSFFRGIGRLFVRLGRFLKDCKSEMKKVVWYGKKPTLNNSLIVLVVMVVFGAVICGLDIGLLWVINKLATVIQL